jgi:quercetin dioxygenase-like cupin family protein
MSRAGDVIENPVTGERAVVVVGTAETNGQLLVADLFVRPGGAVVGEHYHPAIEERFTVVRGRLNYKLDGKEGVGNPGDTIVVPAGVAHQWWNAGSVEVEVRVEVRPAARFEACILNLFGLAQDGRVDATGKPGLLQLAVFAREFDDVIRFTGPPRWVQVLLFGALAPVGRLLGYQGNNPEYLTRRAAGRKPSAAAGQSSVWFGGG